ncbi:MAG: ATP-binding protein [Anaerolineales bacterium]|nr:ATP-binding protein [Anaerolineales bacterium]
MNLSNPYIAGNPVRGTPQFIGRADVLREVLRVLRQPAQNAIVLYGQRRIGKTSVLQQLTEQLPHEGPFHSVYFDLQDKAAWPLARVLTEIAHRIADVLHLPALDLGDDPALAFRKAWLPTILKDLSSSEQNPSSLVLLFDEFDVLADPKGGQAGEKLFPYLRELMSLDPARLQFVFVIGRKVEDLASIALSLFKATRSIRVSLLDREDAFQLARLSEKNETLRWLPEALEKVWELTHGHPFLTQQLCSLVWENLCREDEDLSSPPTVLPEDVERATNKTLTASHAAMEWIWDGLPPAERVVISAMANAGEGLITQEKLKQTLNESGIYYIDNELKDAPQMLAAWDLIEREKDQESYHYSVELFRRWVLRYKPLVRVQREVDLINPLADELYQSAFKLYSAGDKKDAQDIIEKALSKNPNHIRANDLLFVIVTEIGNTKDLFQLYENLIRHQPISTRLRFLTIIRNKVDDEENIKLRLDVYRKIREIAPTDLVHCKLSFLKFLVVRMHFNIMGIELGASGLHRELPVNFDVLGGAFRHQSQNFAFQRFLRWDAAGEALARQSGKLNFNHIQPTGRFGRVEEFKTLRQRLGFIGR